MGADIHLMIEVKIQGTWHCYAALRPPRFYAAFAKLAGVRGNGVEIPISEPKGLPEDLSSVTQVLIDQWGDGGHSHSWLSAEEVSQFYEWLEGPVQRLKYLYVEQWIGTYLDGNGFNYTRWDSKPDWLEDMRWVFFFDN